MNVILATRNPSKAQQIRDIFVGSTVSIFSLDEAGIAGEAVEDGTTLQQNAHKKARYAHEKARKGIWTMADDTGLFIFALNGEPGVYAADWAGKGAETAEITRHCLEQLDGVSDRSATFRTTVALISPEGVPHAFDGQVDGRLLEAQRVPPQPKMPYSGIFVPDGQDLCWAEMTTEAENAISHRGKAFRLARAFLEQQK